jgi:protein TonB
LGGGTASPPAIEPPRCASCPPPPYPAEALDRELEGEVVLSVQVLPDGRVGDIFIEQSSSYPLLDEAAMTGVKTWTFYPAYQEGSTVAAVIRARIPFRLKAP